MPNKKQGVKKHIKKINWFSDHFQKYFWPGIITFVPFVLTVWLIKFIIVTTDEMVIGLLPHWMSPVHNLPVKIYGLGIIVTLLLIFLSGFVATNIFGSHLLSAVNGWLERIPFIGKIYQTSRKLVKTLFGHDQDSFSQAVLVEYPRKGTWTIAFKVGSIPENVLSSKGVEEKLGKKCSSIYVPTTPNPTSGFYLFVPESELVPLDIPVEKAWSTVISLGIMRAEEMKEHAHS